MLRGKNKKAIRPIKTIWRIIGWFERVTHIETRPVLSVSIACIYNLLSVCPPLSRGGKLRAQANSVNSGCEDKQQRSLFVRRF